MVCAMREEKRRENKVQGLESRFGRSQRPDMLAEMDG